MRGSTSQQSSNIKKKMPCGIFMIYLCKLYSLIAFGGNAITDQPVTFVDMVDQPVRQGAVQFDCGQYGYALGLYAFF